ncbi:MAG TPA: glycerol-3-phosphate 1-O-acyltransferase PlsY [Pyrinomonadaceae bacterium]
MRPAIVIIAYLLGSVPFGYLIVRATQGADVRETGSGGTGATNVSRRAGKAAGVITLLLDALKGAAAVAFAKLILGLPVVTAGRYAGSPLLSRDPTEAQWWVAGAAIAAIVGHIFPIWLRFRGGKGVATGVGVFLMLAPIAVALAALVFLLVVALTRYVSLGSILAAVAIPFFVLLQNAFIQATELLAPTMTVAIVGAGLIVFAHRANIRRLLQGTESKFS